jgi:biotin-dependent carboxylase-like uncharacterized protein
VATQLEVLRRGALTTVQDGGRRGVAHLGVPRSGALDPGAMQLANRLVGNSGDAAVLETTVDGVAFRLHESRSVAVTGAPAAVRIDGRAAPWGVAVHLRAGESMEVGRARAGVRSYIAVAGGVLAEPVMGSRSTDVLSGTGPPPLVDGMLLPVGAVATQFPTLDFVPHSSPPEVLHLRCWLGPRDDELRPEALRLLGATPWTVSSSSNRIGLRLDGPRLVRAGDGELATEGLVEGSIQVPPNGQPLVFLADHPTTGGYPVIAVVPEPDIWSCAQAAPGSIIRFHPARLRVPWASTR